MEASGFEANVLNMCKRKAIAAAGVTPSNCVKTKRVRHLRSRRPTYLDLLLISGIFGAY